MHENDQAASFIPLGLTLYPACTVIPPMPKKKYYEVVKRELQDRMGEDAIAAVIALLETRNIVTIEINRDNLREETGLSCVSGVSFEDPRIVPAITTLHNAGIGLTLGHCRHCKRLRSSPKAEEPQS